MMMYVQALICQWLTDDRDDVDLPVETPHGLHVDGAETVTIGRDEV